MKLTVMIICIAGMILSSSAFAAIIRVPSEQPTIQAGIDAAVDGDTVLVADGTYTGDGNRDIDFKGKAITVTSENGAETCIVDCQGTAQENHRGFYFHQGETNESVVSGFTVQNGHSDQGGGIRCSSSPTITNSIITGNHAVFGGGISCVGYSPTIVNCAISENFSVAGGGGISCEVSSPIVVNCTFFGNESWVYGAIFGSGGGIYCSESSPMIINCTFVGNTSTAFLAGAIGCYDSPSLVVMNCILWNNSIEEMDTNGGDPTVTNSCIKGGWPGIGNINADPLFIGGDPFNYHLLPDSPCVDAGTTEGAPTTDMDGNPRPNATGVDMGAYEFYWPSVTTAFITMPSHLFKPGDKASCIGSVWNPHEFVFDEYLFFAVLDIWGTFYCAPSYNMIDYYFQDCNPGLTEIQIMPEFIWPSGVGSVSGIVWYAGLVNPEMTEIVSEIGVFDFGWSE